MTKFSLDENPGITWAIKPVKGDFSMSHYSTIKTKFKYRAELIKALQDLYGKDLIEASNKNNIKLNGYYGNETQTAEIVARVKGKHTMADIGFVKGSDDLYETIMDGTYGLKNIVAKYAETVIKTRLPRKYQVVSNDGNEISIKQLY